MSLHCFVVCVEHFQSILAPVIPITWFLRSSLRVKTLGAFKLYPVQWPPASTFGPGLRVFSTFVWMQRCLANVLVPKLGFPSFFFQHKGIPRATCAKCMTRCLRFSSPLTCCVRFAFLWYDLAEAIVPCQHHCDGSKFFLINNE